MKPHTHTHSPHPPFLSLFFFHSLFFTYSFLRAFCISHVKHVPNCIMTQRCSGLSTEMENTLEVEPGVSLCQLPITAWAGCWLNTEQPDLMCCEPWPLPLLSSLHLFYPPSVLVVGNLTWRHKSPSRTTASLIYQWIWRKQTKKSDDDWCTGYNTSYVSYFSLFFFFLHLHFQHEFRLWDIVLTKYSWQGSMLPVLPQNSMITYFYSSGFFGFILLPKNVPAIVLATLNSP